MRCLPLLILLIVLSTPAIAQSGHLVLLAVGQNSTGDYYGGTADLYLTVKAGSGRVFLETFPLSKLDTQISTRFAKEVACKFLDKDCSNLDFFYTIQSRSAIIGGPSAGGSISVLTAAVLDGQRLKDDVAMSGTINSGNIIGPVGHLKEKISAASDRNIITVLIPSGQRFYENKSNETIDLQEYGDSINVTIDEVVDIGDALTIFSGKDYSVAAKNVSVPRGYSDVMKGLSVDLCDHVGEIIDEINTVKYKDAKALIDTEFIKKYEQGINLTEKADAAFAEDRYYASASYCFSAAVEFRKLLLDIRMLDDEQLAKMSERLENELKNFDLLIEGTEKHTITDLQAYMIVKERISEARAGLEIENNSDALAYVTERLYSAQSWASFFGTPGRQFNLDEEELRNSCMIKLREVDERIQFVDLFFPGAAENIRENSKLAYEYFTSGDYELCLFKASKTKAEANVIVSVIGVSEQEFDAVLENKFLSAQKAIGKQVDRNMFPIIAYSYYEYGRSLEEEDKYSALIYAEYALELSNLDIYFKQKRLFEIPMINFWLLWTLVLGLIVGYIAGRISARKKNPSKPTEVGLPGKKR